MSTEGPTSHPQKESFPVHLNIYVYDVSFIKRHLCRLGLGFYRTGVQVHETEYMFCEMINARGEKMSGIVLGNPQRCHGSQGLTFWKSILIGHTEKDPNEVNAQIEELGKDYANNSYNLLTKNCNHFSNHACRVLTGKRIPRWVNLFSTIGRFCNCVVPAEVLNLGPRRA